jgi:NAD(P)-dependent dehydrogenase (short-subunit alcohol dehydrogenase family)
MLAMPRQIILMGQMVVRLLGKPIKVSTVYPGYIRSEINEKVKKTPFMIDTATGCRLLATAIEREPVKV